jgi:molybdopterin-guanine dinucleotide biosynthesis protein A
MMNSMSLSAFVLAGGQSRRMGRDKALVQFNGRTMLEHALAIVRTLDAAAWIVGPAERYGQFAECIADEFPGQGPLAGIHAALRRSQAELNVILAVDTPLVTPELLRYLVTRAASSPALAVVPGASDEHGRERLHPLCGVYRCAFADAAQAALHAGRNQIEPVLRQGPLLVIGEAELVARGFPAAQLRNLNTPEDIAAVE